MESMKVSTMRFLTDRHTFLEYGSVIICLFSHFSTHLCSCVTGEKAADFYAPLPVIMREVLHRLNDDSFY